MDSLPSRPDEVPVDILQLAIERLVTDALETPDSITQALPDSEVVRYAIAVISYGRAITEQLMQSRWPIVADARWRGATVGIGWSEAAPGCRDCGHSFSPDSSPHLDRCWECAERADAGGVL